VVIKQFSGVHGSPFWNRAAKERGKKEWKKKTPSPDDTWLARVDASDAESSPASITINRAASAALREPETRRFHVLTTGRRECVGFELPRVVGRSRPHVDD